MKLSQHFSYDEAVRSQTAARLKIDNTPSAEVLTTMKRTAQHMEHIRTLLGFPIVVSSWFRCGVLNSAIGGTLTSQHIKGEAVDFTCPGFGTPREIVARLENAAPYDQLILEYADSPGGGWVHVSFTSNPRGQLLAIGCKL